MMSTYEDRRVGRSRSGKFKNRHEKRNACKVAWLYSVHLIYRREIYEISHDAGVLSSNV